MEVEFDAINDDCMASVVSALASRDNVHLVRKDIDEFAFALVAPLRAEDDGHRSSHGIGVKGKQLAQRSRQRQQ